MLRHRRPPGRHACAPIGPDADLAAITELADRVHGIAGDLELALQITGIGDDIPDWLRHRQGLTPDGLREAGAAAILSGDLERDAEALEHLREATGVSYLTVPASSRRSWRRWSRDCPAPDPAPSNPPTPLESADFGAQNRV